MSASWVIIKVPGGNMKKVAIFGNTGGGKSTLARRLAEVTNLPLHSLDKIKYRSGGAEVPHEEYLRVHAQLLEQPEWIIDGFGCVPSTWERIAAADMLIYLDLPLALHGLWVTKRMVQGMFTNPEGWPEDSPILKSTLQSYRVLWLCHQKLTPRYRKLVEDASSSKEVFHLRSPNAMRAFLNEIAKSQKNPPP